MLDHNQYPETTLFMLMSMDGKISTGLGNSYDVDSDFPKIKGIREGLHQYYEKEQETDLWSLVTGKTMAKIGINTGNLTLANVEGLHRVIVGVKDLTRIGIKAIVDNTNYTHFIVDGEKDLREVSLALIGYPKSAYTVRMFKKSYHDPKAWLKYLKHIGCDKITLQAGSTVNGAFAESHVIDHVHVVMAPVLIGGATTPGLIGGNDRKNGLSHLNVLKLVSVVPLNNSYVDLMYDVM